MSNVFAFRPARPLSRADSAARLLRAVAQDRRASDDVFWLKENAELLGVLAATDTRLDEAALAALAPFYAQIAARLRFFPQYYRFLLSICLDLEDLGMGGRTGAVLCDWAAREGLAEAELSDLQRAEARRLLARRGVGCGPDQGALDARLRAFTERSETFALPNKKAAYELTHIVFYLSEYGRRDPDLSAQTRRSLAFCGVLAYLDQNMDLLAEVCTALRFAGQEPPAVWSAAVAAHHRSIQVFADDTAPLADGFHAYLVTGWAMDVAGQGGFSVAVPEGAVRFGIQPTVGALRPLSTCLFEMGEARSANWGGMRDRITPYLTEDTHEVLMAAERSTDHFEAFFERFARAGAPEPAP